MFRPAMSHMIASVPGITPNWEYGLIMETQDRSRQTTAPDQDRDEGRNSLQKIYNCLNLAMRYISLQDTSWLNWFQGGYYIQFSLDSGELPPLLPTAGVEWKRDIGYISNTHTSTMQSLDLFTPNHNFNLEEMPVVIFIHGGGWRAGDKHKSIHVHSNFCISLAQKGMIVVNVNHRLSPKIKHPGQINDVALALKWVQDHIRKYGGDPEKTFVAGHSSGGHLGALIALDLEYLRQVSIRQPDFIKGVIGISGVYDIAHFAQSTFPRRFMVEPVFGKHRSTWQDASPMTHVRKDAPPFLLIDAENDDLNIESSIFREKLEASNVQVINKTFRNTNHFTILSYIGKKDYLLTDCITDFISGILKP